MLTKIVQYNNTNGCRNYLIEVTQNSVGKCFVRPLGWKPKTFWHESILEAIRKKRTIDVCNTTYANGYGWIFVLRRVKYSFA